MNLTVYIPRSLQDTLRQRALAADLTPARYLQHLLRQDIENTPEDFSPRFADLAGSWETNDVLEVIRDIEDSRTNSERPELA